MNTSAIRAEKRRRRANLSDEQIADVSLEIAATLWRQPFMMRSKRIAAYWAFDGEVECRFFIESAWKRGRHIYLPVIRNQSLAFAHFCAKTVLFPNRYGIPEPVCAASRLYKPGEMDVVLTPLVAFDTRGNRIGMGAGFYDRSFRFIKNRSNWLHPRLIGLAYEFQKTAQIKASTWDIPLHDVVTENCVYAIR